MYLEDLYWGTWSGSVVEKRYKLIWGQDYLLKQRVNQDQTIQGLPKLLLYL